MPLDRELIHGGDLAGSEEKYPGQEFLDFSSNINPLGLPPGVKHALLEGADDCARYPDPLCRGLTAALARYEGVREEMLLCGGGAADLIYRLAYGLRPQKALLPAPSFAEYEEALRQTGCDLTFHSLLPENGFLLGEDILPKIDGTDLVMLCNPNNPTGALIPPPLLNDILTACGKTGAWLAVDECFLDFLPQAERHSLKSSLERTDRLVVFKAFTKIFAMPGLRLGYAMSADRELLGAMARAGPPWNVPVPAQLCGIAATEEMQYLQRSRGLISEQRERMRVALEERGFTVYPGSANFLFFHSTVYDLRERLEARGILIRDCSNFRGLKDGYYRVAVRLPEENGALLQAVNAVL